MADDIRRSTMGKATILTRNTVKKGLQYTVYTGRGDDGRRLSLGTFPSRKAAEKVAKDYNSRLEDGNEQVEALMTLTQYVEGPWRTNTELEPSTRKGYLSYLNNHILPIIGHKRVSTITRTDVLRMIDTLRAQGRSEHTLNRCKMVLSSVMSSLMDIEAIDSNPVVRIKAPRPAPPNKPVLLPDEVRGILGALPNEAARLFAHVLIESGLRVRGGLGVKEEGHRLAHRDRVRAPCRLGRRGRRQPGGHRQVLRQDDEGPPGEDHDGRQGGPRDAQGARRRHGRR
jgi:hypothetical protein